jgi:hypothetical protein
MTPHAPVTAAHAVPVHAVAAVDDRRSLRAMRPHAAAMTASLNDDAMLGPSLRREVGQSDSQRSDGGHSQNKSSHHLLLD